MMDKVDMANRLGDRILIHSNALRKTKGLLIKSKDKESLQQHHTDMLNYYKERLQALRILGDADADITLDKTIIKKHGRIYREW